MKNIPLRTIVSLAAIATSLVSISAGAAVITQPVKQPAPVTKPIAITGPIHILCHSEDIPSTLATPNTLLVAQCLPSGKWSVGEADAK